MKTSSIPLSLFPLRSNCVGEPRREHQRSNSTLCRRAALTLLLVLTFCFITGAEASAPQNKQAQDFADRGLRLAREGDLKNAEAELRRAVELDPEDPEYLSDLGVILGMERKLEEADRYFEKALQLDPNNVVIRRDLAANLWQLYHLHEAKQHLERLLRIDPKDEQSILLLGMVSENLKDYARAAHLLGSVPSLVRERPESIAALATSYYQTGSKEKARQTLDALVGYPAGPTGVFLGGQVALKAQDYETAEKLFLSIRSTYPDRAALTYSLALAQYHAKQFDKSERSLLDLISTGHGTSDAYNLLGWCCEKQNRTKEAIQALEHAINADPSKEANYLDVGRIAMAHRLLPFALKVETQAVEQIPTSAQVYLLKGMVEWRMGQFTDAIRSYTRAGQLNPALADANLGRAVSQAAAGMTKEAKATFELGLKRFPGDAQHYLEYARVLLKLAETGDASAESRAVSLLEKAIALDTSLAAAHYELGNLHLKKGRNAEALRELERAASLDPENSKTHYALARVTRRLGRAEEASKELRIYQKLEAAEEKSVSGFLPAGIHPN